jgi:hypothetical protein
MQPSDAVPIGGGTKSLGGELGYPSASRSPGMQWLHHLGVAAGGDPTPGRAPREEQLMNLPSASAWLGRKSRQLLGLPPSPNTGKESTEVPPPTEGGPDSAGERSKEAPNTLLPGTVERRERRGASSSGEGGPGGWDAPRARRGAGAKGEGEGVEEDSCGVAGRSAEDCNGGQRQQGGATDEHRSVGPEEVGSDSFPAPRTVFEGSNSGNEFCLR